MRPKRARNDFVSYPLSCKNSLAPSLLLAGDLRFSHVREKFTRPPAKSLLIRPPFPTGRGDTEGMGRRKGVSDTIRACLAFDNPPSPLVTPPSPRRSAAPPLKQVLRGARNTLSAGTAFCFTPRTLRNVLGVLPPFPRGSVVKFPPHGSNVRFPHGTGFLKSPPFPREGGIQGGWGGASSRFPQKNAPSGGALFLTICKPSFRGRFGRLWHCLSHVRFYAFTRLVRTTSSVLAVQFHR